MLLSIVATYSVRNLMFDVWLGLAFGCLGYVLKKLAFPMAPLVLAMVLGDMVESNYARSLIMSTGSHAIFAERPLTAALIAVSALSVLWPVVKGLRGKFRRDRIAG